MKHYWSINIVYCHPLFHETMERNRFELTLSCGFSTIMAKLVTVSYPGRNLWLEKLYYLGDSMYIPNKTATYICDQVV